MGCAVVWAITERCMESIHLRSMSLTWNVNRRGFRRFLRSVSAIGCSVAARKTHFLPVMGISVQAGLASIREMERQQLVSRKVKRSVFVCQPPAAGGKPIQKRLDRKLWCYSGGIVNIIVLVGLYMIGVPCILKNKSGKVFEVFSLYNSIIYHYHYHYLRCL